MHHKIKKSTTRGKKKKKYHKTLSQNHTWEILVISILRKILEGRPNLVSGIFPSLWYIWSRASKSLSINTWLGCSQNNICEERE